MIRTYTDLMKLGTFAERFDYLKLQGKVGADTFGFDRYFNQIFYKSKEWKSLRDFVIIRDGGFDLGVEGYDIRGRILVHHMNPLSVDDIVKKSDFLLNPEYMISVSHRTHNAIHYGDEAPAMETIAERKPNDTCPWR